MTTDFNDVHSDGSEDRAVIVLALSVSVCLTMTTDSNDVNDAAASADTRLTDCWRN